MAGAVVVNTHRMWASLDMRVALARHDVGTVFRLMQRYGFSQRAIAALTGITQAEVSEIVSGRRRVLAYSVLERLADGLQLPRGWVGLAFDDESQLLRDRHCPTTPEPANGQVRQREQDGTPSR